MQNNPMNISPRIFNLHLVSDSTGETLSNVARACCVQFEGVEPDHHIWSLIRHDRQLDMVLQGIKEKPGIVLFTLVNPEHREKLVTLCRSMAIPYVPVMEAALTAFSSYLGLSINNQPGRQHTLDTDYYSRIEAMEFALACDDGAGLEKLHRADVVVVGVSRTSKTPTCLYLANRGIFAANVPLVREVGVPDVLFSLTHPLVVGLTRDAATLADIRKNRLRQQGEDSETSYTDDETVIEEVREARKLVLARGWPLIDVTRRSIEETAAEIINLLNRKKHERGELA